ncbi:hypothetical protein BC826DRAFT_1174444 [Russula brevipes]|nr:hypothetical protein BC826DRAFT_1174444 [Russula brevipes]
MHDMTAGLEYLEDGHWEAKRHDDGCPSQRVMDSPRRPRQHRPARVTERKPRRGGNMNCFKTRAYEHYLVLDNLIDKIKPYDGSEVKIFAVTTRLRGTVPNTGPTFAGVPRSGTLFAPQPPNHVTLLSAGIAIYVRLLCSQLGSRKGGALRRELQYSGIMRLQKKLEHLQEFSNKFGSVSTLTWVGLNRGTLAGCTMQITYGTTTPPVTLQI